MSFASARFRGSVVALAIASGLQALLSIALLPLATLVLDAADFGAYALLMSVVALAVAISDGGGALALPAHFGPADANSRGRMIVTFASVSGGLGVVSGLVLLVFWQWNASIVSSLGIEPSAQIWLACAALVPLRALSATATVVFSVSGRGIMIAAQLATQAFATFVAAISALLIFDLGLLSLFLGAVTGQLLSLVVAGIALRSNFIHRPSRRWCSVALVHAPTAAVAGLVDGARVFAENALVARASGLEAVGFFAHSKLYYGFGIAASNAVAQNAWSISLSEAREKDRRFARTGRIWEAVHLVVFLAGLGSVALGDDVITLLTNDMLTPAAAYLPWLLALLLVNLSGRAAQAALFAAGLGAVVTRVRTGLTVAILATLPILVSEIGGIGLSLGIAGLIGASIAEAIVYRLYLRRRAASLGNLAFQDFWVLVGLIGIGTAAIFDAVMDPALLLECIVFVVAAATALLVDWARGGPVRMIAALRRARA